MNLLGDLQLNEGWKNRALVNNVSSIAANLEFDAFDTTGLCTAISECIRHCQLKTGVCKLSLSLTNLSGNIALVFQFYNYRQSDESPSLEYFFDEVSSFQSPESDGYILELHKHLPNKEVQISSSQLEYLQSILNQKSREELMEDIQSHNQKLEKTVRERTEELNEALLLAKSANDAKSSFLAAMSHEIRTPMNGVVGMIDLLRQTKLDADQKQMTGTVRDSAFSLLQIINDILDFSKIEANKMDLENISFSISRTMEGVIDTLTPNVEKKGLLLITFIDPKIPNFVLGDQVRIRQILFNIAGNAIKFTENLPEKRGKIFLRADLIAGDNRAVAQVRYSIRDNGIGIAKDVQSSLFDPFTQAETSTARHFGGTGLGLSICTKLSGMMGGSIDVQSELGEGSTFSVTIPHELSTEAVSNTQQSDLDGLQILLISRLDEHLEILPIYLSHWNASVEILAEIPSANTVKKVLTSSSVPDIVVLGPDLSKVEQHGTRKLFRAHSQSSQLRFVLMEKGYQQGAKLSPPDSVTVDAQPLRRSSFVTAIAVSVGRESPEIHYEEALESIIGRESPDLETAEAAGQLILVAEDNITNQDVIRRQLNLLGYAVEIADNGELAFAAWKSRNFALLLTDCNMPEMDGFQLTKAIRKDETGADSHLPIIAITANALEGEADKCLAAGMDDYLSKPLEMPKLKKMLQNWMPESQISHPDIERETILVDTGAKTQEHTKERCEGPIDERALKDEFGEDHAVFTEILTDFVSPSQAIIEELKSAKTQNSAEGVRQAAHKLKSAARSVGANRLADLCQQLETVSTIDDWKIINAELPKVDGMMSDVVGYIESL